MSNDAPTFEAAFARLEEIIASLEAGELELDAALALFEEGVGLLRLAGQQLSHADVRVQQLLGNGEGWGLRPFRTNE